MTTQSKFDTVIFDLDGTIVDTAFDVMTCVNLVREEWGLSPISLIETQQAIGPGPRRFVEMVLPPELYYRRKEFMQRFRNLYQNHLLDQTRLFPGIMELLQELKRGKIKMVVATNKPRSFCLGILKGLNCQSFFNFILGPEDVTNHKPQPDIVLKAIELTQSTVKRTLMIGDTDNDIMSGRNAGVKTCAVTYGYGSENLLRALRPDFLVSHPSEITVIILNCQTQ
ncbi:hypothetical protein DRP98_05100 [candidate division KSB1 bacterium]|nr:MAG: hypothetical protein DRP98_05100 [candidate division KSB1 bacterium]